jgi:hypothetical protein
MRWGCKTNSALHCGPAFAMLCFIVGCGANQLRPSSVMLSQSPPTTTPPQPVTVTGTKKSISRWTRCDGVTDDIAGVTQAFAAAKNNAFILEVDCPVYMHVGMDIMRPIFIENGTHVDFTSTGLLIVDNTLIPSFVIADTYDVALTNWNLEYKGSLPINYKTGGYYYDGVWVNNDGSAPSSVFNDWVLTQWLTANRGINFARGVHAQWAGPTDLSAIFYLTGSTSHIDVEDMNVWVPSTAGGDHYVPMVFALTVGQTSDQSVTSSTPLMKPYFETPNNLTFSGITLDGTYFGFQGSAQNMQISNVVSYRYGDLQDADGGNVGGIANWFAPPHLFYFNYNPTQDASLYNNNIVIEKVMDYGERTGIPRDTTSGNCYSLKLGDNHGTVSNYTSLRPDGFMDVLSSSELTLTNITASYDSSFLHETYPMIRFPEFQYHEVTFTNVKLQDKADSTSIDPIQGNTDTSNTNITFNRTTITLNQWTGRNAPEYSPTVPGTRPYFAGTGNSFDIQISQ